MMGLDYHMTVPVEARGVTGYTPTVEEIEMGFVYHMAVQDGDGGSARTEHSGAFARWLAANNAEVAATTLREAADALKALPVDRSKWRCMGDMGEDQWLRDRGDALEGEVVSTEVRTEGVRWFV